MLQTLALECPQKRGKRPPQDRCAWQSKAWLTTRRPEELAVGSVFLRLPEAGREQLEDFQVQKKGHDGACIQVWHIVMDMECIKLSWRTSWHRHDVKNEKNHTHAVVPGK